MSSAAEQAATRAIVADLFGDQPAGKAPATRANGAAPAGVNPAVGKGQVTMRGQPPSRSGSIPPAGNAATAAIAGIKKQGTRTQSLGPKPNGRALAKPSEEESPRPKELVTPKVMQAAGPNGTSGKAPPLITVTAPTTETEPVASDKPASVPADSTEVAPVVVKKSAQEAGVPVESGNTATDPPVQAAKVPKRSAKGAEQVAETPKDAKSSTPAREKVAKPVRKGAQKERTDDAVHAEVISSTVGTPATRLKEPARRSRKVSASSSSESSESSGTESESDTESDASDTGSEASSPRSDEKVTESDTSGSDIASVRSTPPREDAEKDATADDNDGDGNEVAVEADDLPEEAEDTTVDLDPILRPGNILNPYPVLGLKKARPTPLNTEGFGSEMTFRHFFGEQQPGRDPLVPALAKYFKMGVPALQDYMSDNRNWNKLRKALKPGELKVYNSITGGYHKGAHPSKVAVKEAASPFTDIKLTKYMQEKHGISCFGRFPLIVHGALALPLECLYLNTPSRDGPRGPEAVAGPSKDQQHKPKSKKRSKDASSAVKPKRSRSLQ